MDINASVPIVTEDSEQIISQTDFVHLHCHTDFSILDSLISTKELFERAKQLGQKAIAVTDHGSLGSAWSALKASKETGVKLIIGCEMYFLNSVAKKDERFRHIILLAKNAIGYKNLLTLNKKGFDNSSIFAKKVIPLIDWDLLKQHSDGLICLTSCSNGILAQLLMNKKFAEAEEQLQRLIEIFGDNLGIEVQANTLKRNANAYNDLIEQVYVNSQLIKLAKKYQVRCVATANCHYVNKEDHKVHDVLLAIGSHQNIYSNFRLKYNCPDFYIKSGDEMKAFFERNYGEFAAELCANSVYFANLCEEPEWIDPKYSNPSGKELPIFPIKDEPDYQEFLTWKEQQSEKLQKLDDDKLYLRRKCYLAFDKIKHTIPKDKLQTYIDRIEDELETLEYQGFSSYMLIVADYVGWCKENGIAVGPGRGCNFYHTKVLTTNGFKNLGEIEIGESVFSHSGIAQNVSNKFVFDIENKEKCLKIKSENAYKSLIMTKDHKILAVKSEETEKYKKSTSFKSKIKKWKNPQFKIPEWIQSQELKVNDFIYSEFPKRNYTYIPEKVDLSVFANFGYNVNKQITNKYIQYKLSNQNISIKRFIKYDDNFLYLLGRFVGDGWFSSEESAKFNNKNTLGIAFNSNDKRGINRIFNHFKLLGFNPLIEKHKYKNVTQIVVNNKIIVNYFRNLFPDYKQKPNTKSLPPFFRYLPSNKLKPLLMGLAESDGSIEGNRESIDTVSIKLALEIKEALLYLKIPSTIMIRPSYYRMMDGKEYYCQESYKIRFRGLRTKINDKFITSNGYFSKILKIEEEDINKVYDITVDQDHSYLTANGVVHNSVAGCYLAYLLDIHQADSIKYGLIFERFQNKLRKQFPDIDQDVSTVNRGKVLDYLKNKYGENNFCSISNYNTITPKVYVRDMCRALELGGSKEEAVKLGNDLSSMISNDAAKLNSFSKVLEATPLLNEYCNNKYKELIDYSIILGKFRNNSSHAAGVIISQRELVGLAPLRKDKDNNLIIEYDKDISEENGFVKMDVLGLSNLDIIDNTISLIKNNNKPFNNEHLNYDANDLKTYELISAGDTFGVFQFGTSGGTIELCKKIKPRNIEDLAVITTLARPAAASIRDKFIGAREGKIKTTLLHPSLGGAFEKTHGFGLFDESILQLGRDVAGWSYNDADRIRKMIKEKGKNPAKDKKLRDEFIESSIKNLNISKELAIKIWDEEVKKFSGYTFNKCISFSEKVDIYTPEGKFLQAKNIQDVEPGDYIRSRDEISAKDIFVSVKEKHDHGILPVVEVELTSGEKIKCTINHKFRVEETGEMLPLWQIIKEQLTIVVTKNSNI